MGSLWDLWEPRLNNWVNLFNLKINLGINLKARNEYKNIFLVFLGIMGYLIILCSYFWLLIRISWTRALYTGGIWVLQSSSCSTTFSCLPERKICCQLPFIIESDLLSFLLWRNVSLTSVKMKDKWGRLPPFPKVRQNICLWGWRIFLCV